MLGRGRTGSGKTIAFGAPLVERLLTMRAGATAGERREFGRSPRALILAPTRELALQIDRTIQPIARSVGLFTTQIYGGVPYARQLGALQRGVDIVIGTPGRIQDLLNQGKLDLSKTVITVLDEADHMCELGFLEPVQEILDQTAEGGQKLLFSATLDKGVASIVEQYLVNPTVHEVAGEDQASSNIEHRVLLLDQRDKQSVLLELVEGEGRKLVFARTRAFAEQLAELFEDEGIPAVSLHGDLNQNRRTRALERLTSGRVNVLVATDVAARGIHVDDIALVIQADHPTSTRPTCTAPAVPAARARTAPSSRSFRATAAARWRSCWSAPRSTPSGPRSSPATRSSPSSQPGSMLIRPFQERDADAVVALWEACGLRGRGTIRESTSSASSPCSVSCSWWRGRGARHGVVMAATTAIVGG